MQRPLAKAFLLLGASLILAATTSGYSTARQPVHIEKVWIATLGWLIHTDARLSTEDMLLYTKERKESVFDTVATDKSILNAFEKLQAQRVDSVPVGRLHVMMVCFLYNSDKTIDTVSFGRGMVYQLNRNYYSINQSVVNLLRSLANICSGYHREGMLFQLEAIEEQMTDEQKRK